MSGEPNVDATLEKPSQRSAATSIDEVRGMFEEAYNVYLQSLMETQTEVQKQYGDIYQTYFGDLSEGQNKVQQRLENVNIDYMEAMKVALDPEAEQVRWEDVYKKSASELKKSQEMLQTDCDSAYEKYRENLQKLVESNQRRNLDSCHTYLNAVKKCWSQLNIEDIDVNTLTTIVQTLSAASSFASSALAAKSDNYNAVK